MLEFMSERLQTEVISKIPHGYTNPKIVLGYTNQIKLMVDEKGGDKEKWTKNDFAKLEQLKVKYLEIILGYKIEPLSKTVSHDDYEKNLKQTTDFVH